MAAEKKYWFPAKSYGWGWGMPNRWQGWVVFLVYFVLIALGFVIAPPQYVPVYYFSYVTILSAALLFICWKKGEPPSWHWGNKE